jgi:quinol monooxygenase YgiN
VIIITGSARVAEGNREAFLPVGERQVLNSRREPGCLSYAMCEDAMEPGRFFFYEEWKDQAAVDFHFRQPYCLEFIARARELAASPPEIKIHRIAE